MIVILLLACPKPKPDDTTTIPVDNCTLEGGSGYIGGPELCNGVDDNCNAEIDEGIQATVYLDNDQDGYGDPNTMRETCDPVDNEVENADDCDDTEPTTYPRAPDACDDFVDSDCDPRDTQCGEGGDYDMANATAKLYADKTNYYTAEYIDVGDVNGDGKDDIAVTTMYADNYNGGGYVLFGPFSGTVTLDDAGDKLVGSRSTISAGRSIAVGDVNGDGIDDVAIGAPDQTCLLWTFYGPLGGDVDLVDAPVIRTGQPDTEVGHGSDIADINGDNVADLIMGAYEDDAGGTDAGTVFIEFGPLQDGEAQVEDVSDLILVGELRMAYAGRYVHAGKDVNGDGINDILVAAPYASAGAPSSGAAYLVYGGIAGEVSLGDADAKYAGEASGDYAGEGLGLGDVDGDGLADVLLGSYNSQGGNWSGAAYIVRGPGTGTDALANADWIIRGERGQQQLGISMLGEDLDGDGVDELWLGAKGDSTKAMQAGAVYGWWGPLPSGGLTLADASVLLVGESGRDALGSSIGAGDFDGDGMGDLAMGAPADTEGGVGAGALFIQSAVHY